MKQIKKMTICFLIVAVLFSGVQIVAFGAVQTTADMQADALNRLGLLAGTKNGYELHKQPTRMEAVVMLIHLMGEKETVTSKAFSHTFKDVPAWAQDYAGYAYQKGISSGISKEKFGSQDLCTKSQYLTFILRILGYNDRKGDFYWDDPYALARSAGLLDKEEQGQPMERFTRGDMVQVSYRALTAKGNTTEKNWGDLWKTGNKLIAIIDSLGYHTTDLKDKLIQKGVFTAEQYAAVIEEYQKGPKTVKAVYLTFDDGPSKKVTPQILKTLYENGVPATFFMLGTMAEKNPAIVRNVYQEGHKIATHGYSHNYKYLYEKKENLLADVKKGNEAINKALGFDIKNKAFRFPGGSFGRDSLFKDALTKEGYRYYDWNCSGEDAVKKGGSTAKEIASSAMTTSLGKKGDLIVLLHDTDAKKTTAEALPDIIQYFRNQGYVFQTLE